MKHTLILIASLALSAAAQHPAGKGPTPPVPPGPCDVTPTPHWCNPVNPELGPIDPFPPICTKDEHCEPDKPL